MESKPKRAGKKVVALGHIIEVYEYENPAWFDFNGQGGRRAKDEPESERAEENRRLSCRRAREQIRRLCLANFDEGSRFITLTFADNVTDLDQANDEFKKFIKRIKYKYGEFKYIAVIEFQERGAVHYHMMNNLPYIPSNELRELWGNGFVKINIIDHVDNVGAYMIKYMLKDTDDPRLKGRKSYLASKNLDKPSVIRGDQADWIIKNYKLDEQKKVYEGSYPSEHHGNITYSEYNLKRLDGKQSRQK